MNSNTLTGEAWAREMVKDYDPENRLRGELWIAAKNFTKVHEEWDDLADMEYDAEKELLKVAKKLRKHYEALKSRGRI